MNAAKRCVADGFTKLAAVVAFACCGLDLHARNMADIWAAPLVARSEIDGGHLVAYYGNHQDPETKTFGIIGWADSDADGIPNCIGDREVMRVQQCWVTDVETGDLSSVPFVVYHRIQKVGLNGEITIDVEFDSVSTSMWVPKPGGGYYGNSINCGPWGGVIMTPLFLPPAGVFIRIYQNMRFVGQAESQSKAFWNVAYTPADGYDVHFWESWWHEHGGWGSGSGDLGSIHGGIWPRDNLQMGRSVTHGPHGFVRSDFYAPNDYPPWEVVGDYILWGDQSKAPPVISNNCE